MTNKFAIYKTPNIFFGAILKELRIKRKISQKNLAELSGLSREYIGQLERGQKFPALVTLFLISEALEINPSKFIRLMEQANSK